MPVVTVIGASNRPFSIPISGSRANTLGHQFERSVGDARSTGTSTATDSVAGATSSSLATGANSVSGISNSSLQITQSGTTAHIGDSNLVKDSSAGNNTIYAGSHNTVTGGVNDTISAAGDLRVEGGQNSHITVNGPLTFLGGTGESNVQAGNATIFGTSNSVYHYVGTNAGNTQLQLDGNGSQNQNGVTTFEGQASGANHILFDASSSHGSLLAHVGNGDTIQGGSASDTISINNGTDTQNGASMDATLSGGSGAPNLFEFLNGKGGHYTITDFGSAAGNTVGLSSSQMGNLQHVLDSETITGGNTTIRLDDQTQITFLNDTHLKHSDFHSL